MSKELIAMCDCPEIQDRWKPKKGDVVVGRKSGETYILEQCDMPQRPEFIKEHEIYIPRIEDVLDMVKDFYGDLSPNVESWIDIEIEESPSIQFIKSLLKAYMHLSHNKTWNGRAWE